MNLWIYGLHVDNHVESYAYWNSMTLFMYFLKVKSRPKSVHVYKYNFLMTIEYNFNWFEHGKKKNQTQYLFHLNLLSF